MIFSHYLQTTDIGANVGATNLYVLLFIQKITFCTFFYAFMHNDLTTADVLSG